MYTAHGQRGQVLPLVAICLAVLMLFAGLAVDAGYWSYQQRQQQNAADAAALGGAQTLLASGCNNQTAANAAGQHDAAINGYTNGSGGIVVTVNNPSTIGPYAGQNCAVSAMIKNSNVSRFFSALLTSRPIPVTTQAVASLVANANGCIYIMNPLLVLQLNAVNLQAPNCAVLADSLVVQTNASTVNVAALGYAQLYQNNLSTYPEASPSQIPPFADPCPEISGCAYLAANPVTYSSCTAVVVSGVNKSINPGCYSELVVSGGTLTMSAGSYEFTGTIQQSGGSIVGKGVTMYLTSGAGPVQINAASNVTLTAPTSGANANVLLYQPPNNLNVVQFNAGTQMLSGLIYAPGAVGQVNATGGGYTVMVFGSMQFNASPSFVYGGPLSGSSIIRNAVLVQ